MKQFGAVGDGTADDTAAIQAAINYAETIGGCVVRVPAGTYKITNTLNIGLLGAMSATLIGDGPGLEGGGGGSSASSVIQWWGATAGGSIMVQQSGVTVWGMEGMTLDGRYRPGATTTTNKPDYGLVLDRTTFSRFRNIRITGWMRCGLWIQPITTANNDNCQFNEFINISVDGYNPAGTAVELHGNSATFGGTELHTSNVCHNTFVQTHIVHAHYGIDVYDADNNSFLMTRIFVRPEATDPNPYGLFLRGSYARALYFFHLQAGGGVNCGPASTALIYGFDKENGAPNPTIDATAKVMWTSHGNNAQGFTNDSYMNNMNVLLSGDPVLANSGAAEKSLFTIFNGSSGARLAIGITNSPRSIDIYSHASSIPTKPAISFGTDTVTKLLLGGKVRTTGTAAPTTGSWVGGDMVYTTAPTAGGFVGWICTASGTPGTWKTFGAISA